ncbi:lipase family protein [Mycolicibacterium sediminis]|uniref:lipase family protein n=1 Tax=Mycolicibacterium sediminis TaxID=1286180 RepID=UPI001FE569E2|nr:lipase family protein [Mycolicibacterium sediminis]
MTLALGACATTSAPAGDDVGTKANGELLADPVALPLYPLLQGLSSTAVKIRYKSTSGVDESATTVSGIVLVPKGDPPEGGWRMASVGHPTTGLLNSCAPSSDPGLMGSTGVIASFLTFGYVVVMTDYAGLGAPGMHAYLEPKSAAYNVIDAVRATREAVPSTSTSWVGYGVSQGGQAVWAANELMPDYGAGLDLVGSISVAAPTDLRPLVDAMENGTLTVEQRVLMPTILSGLKVAYPDLRLEDYLHGVMLSRLEAFRGCQNEGSELRGQIAQNASADDFRPTSPQAADRLRQILGEIALPSRPASAPMLVAYGDSDKVVLPQWTAEAIDRACGLGDVIETVVAPGQGHGQLDLGSIPSEWTSARFAGLPPSTTCPQP